MYCSGPAGGETTDRDVGIEIANSICFLIELVQSGPPQATQAAAAAAAAVAIAADLMAEQAAVSRWAYFSRNYSGSINEPAQFTVNDVAPEEGSANHVTERAAGQPLFSGETEVSC